MIDQPYSPPILSLIIPAKNEAARIEATVNRAVSIAVTDQIPLEVIVVANDCDDNTASLAAGVGAFVIETSTPGVAHARNLGFHASHGEVLIFLDADTLLGDSFCTCVMSAYQAGFVGGSCDTWPLESTVRGKLFWRVYNFLSRRLLKTNGVAFYTRSAFVALTGYREELTEGEDSDIHSRARSLGSLTHLSGTHVHTSMRRFEVEGYLRTLMRWELSFFIRPTDSPYHEVRP